MFCLYIYLPVFFSSVFHYHIKHLSYSLPCWCFVPSFSFSQKHFPIHTSYLSSLILHLSLSLSLYHPLSSLLIKPLPNTQVTLQVLRSSITSSSLDRLGYNFTDRFRTPIRTRHPLRSPRLYAMTERIK